MQTGNRIYKDCVRCSGDGKLYQRANWAYPQNNEPTAGSYSEITCPSCEGLGIIPWGWLRELEEETMPGDV